MAAKSKRNALIGAGVVGLALLFMVGAGYDEDEDEDTDLDEPGTPGGQPPPDDDGGIDLDDIDPSIFHAVPWHEPEEPDYDPTTGDFPWAPFTGPGEKPWNPGQYEHPDNYPTAGMFHQVEYGDIFGGKGSRHNIAWAALYEAAYAAAVQVGEVDDADARAFAKSIADKGSNRAKYRDLIQCAAWNDVLYATWGYGEKSKAGPHGRAIRLMPYHADNRELVFQRQTPMRNIQMRSPNDKGGGNGRAIDNEYRDGYEYLWLPALNLRALWEDRIITSEGVTWEDGSTRANPPPEIWDLGVDVLEDPGLDEYGCLEGANTWT